ncbi:MAG: aminodeoxychorismate lyase [Pseudomonadales bacterium]
MLINGTFAESIHAGDRGLAYGDGLFETIRIAAGEPVLLGEHLERLREGCQRLEIEVSIADVEADFQRLLAGSEFSDAVIKLILTRGVSGRGYRFEPGGQPTRIAEISAYLPELEPGEQGVATVLCETRLGINPDLAGIKHLNRLEQVMAAREIPVHDYREGLMMSQTDELIEGTKTNLFLVENGQLVTPSLQHCGVKGTMRKFLLERISGSTSPVSLARLERADEVFVCNSVIGIWPVNSLAMAGRESLTWPVGSITQSARQLVEKETGITG